MDRILARRALLAALAVGVVAQALLVSLAVGVNLVLLTAIVLAVAAAMARLAGRRLDVADAWMPVSALAVAAGTAVRSDEALVFLDAVAVATLLGSSVAAFAGIAVTRRSILAIVALGTAVLLWSLGSVLRLTEIARRPDPESTRRSVPPAVRAIARGLALAVPLLLVFSLLFASADAIFASAAGRLVDWQVDLGELPVRACVAFVVAWVVAGLLSVATGVADVEPRPRPAASWRPDAAPPMQSLGAAVAAEAPPAAANPRLGAVEGVTILIAVDG